MVVVLGFDLDEGDPVSEASFPFPFPPAAPPPATTVTAVTVLRSPFGRVEVLRMVEVTSDLDRLVTAVETTLPSGLVEVLVGESEADDDDDDVFALDDGDDREVDDVVNERLVADADDDDDGDGNGDDDDGEVEESDDVSSLLMLVVVVMPTGVELLGPTTDVVEVMMAVSFDDGRAAA